MKRNKTDNSSMLNDNLNVVFRLSLSVLAIYGYTQIYEEQLQIIQTHFLELGQVISLLALFVLWIWCFSPIYKYLIFILELLGKLMDKWVKKDDEKIIKEYLKKQKN